MLMKKILLVISLLCSLTAMGQVDSLRREVMLETTMGNIRIALYNETPLHRDNFLRQVIAGYYDGNLFHRVIRNFMIQTGDSASRHPEPGVVYGNTTETYTVPAEIHFPQLFHKRGAIAAAREADANNPERASSSSQFYIVWGTRCTDSQLDRYQEMLDKNTGGTVKLTPELREYYYRYGGTPYLDGQYTVFGEVVEGLDVVDKIQSVKTTEDDRPWDDIRIIKAEIVK